MINIGLAGQTTGFVYEGEKRFDMVVRLDGDQRKNIEDVQNLLIPINNGTQIPLHQLANVSLKDSPNQIQREDAKRRIIIGFNVRGRDVQSIVQELQLKVDSKLNLPPGYYITYGGAFENLPGVDFKIQAVGFSDNTRWDTGDMYEPDPENPGKYRKMYIN